MPEGLSPTEVGKEIAHLKEEAEEEEKKKGEEHRPEGHVGRHRVVSI